ncbi:hypothetical protein EJ05DRAFT_538254 [Pseudovirgaria hyperparasitica]|uniref:Fe2OG dioxygenase domain-containing protein n=1 Tax=Pseudovirgaria hyperparasitica TaxID=470096 RepID=A0A6A6WA53_9PEZI|nr:uncharacterized protein EJ05DRAFT_538254 [Pseudovirgaria hyperparasitica]KAF2757991.1 hypothetical protein EJ05DRAFT_538254 [Pseudovirgaria hyperparasitica]
MPSPPPTPSTPLPLPTLPKTITYHPTFLTPTEQSTLLSSLPQTHWIPLSNRRLQAWPSPLTPTTSTLLTTTRLPPFLTDPILPRLAQLGIFRNTAHGAPNHVLVNEYAPGQGIMPHEDGPAYAGVVATVSLGGAVVLEIWGKGDGEGSADETSIVEGERKPLYRILQEPGSLLVTTGEAYTDYLHGIAAVEVDEDVNEASIANWHVLGDRGAYAGGRNVRGTRTSLTYRDVLRVRDGRRILGLRG